MLDERVLFTGCYLTEKPGFIYAHKLTGDDWATREPLKFPGHSSNVTCLRFILRPQPTLQWWLRRFDLDAAIVSDVDQKAATMYVRNARRRLHGRDSREARRTHVGVKERIELFNKVDELVLNNQYQFD